MQSAKETLPKLDEIHALSKPVTLNSDSTPQEPKGVNNDKVIAPGMFRINPSKTSREEKQMPNTISASARTKPITVSQPPVITKKNVNSDVNGSSSIGIANTANTRRTQPRSSSKNNKVPYVGKSSYKKDKAADVEENHRNLLSSSNKKHDKDSCGKKQTANVSIKEKQKKRKPKVKKPKNVGSKERLALPKPRSCLRWSPTGRMFDIKGKIIASSESESQSDCSNGDNACFSNPLEPISKLFPNSTLSMTGQNWLNSLLIPLLFEYTPMDKEDLGNNECVIC
nr:hypothetical protein [Tanacetum cinerariifolium]